MLQRNWRMPPRCRAHDSPFPARPGATIFHKQRQHVPELFHDANATTLKSSGYRLKYFGARPMTIELVATASDTRRPQQLARWDSSQRNLAHGDDRQLQYGWTLSLGSDLDWKRIERGPGRHSDGVSASSSRPTPWLVPVEGWFVDRYGPRIVVACGDVLVVRAWALNSVASSLASARSRRGAVRRRRGRGLRHPASAMRSNGFPTAVASPPD